MINKVKKIINSNFVKNNKYKILILLLIIIIIIIYCILIYGKSNKEQKIKLGMDLYNKAHNLYTIGEGIEYEKDKDNNYVYIEQKKETSLKYTITENYYKISNYKNIKNLFTKKEINDLKKEIGIIEKDKNYYIKEISNPVNNYLKTKLEIKYISPFRVKFKAINSFCENGYKVGYGTGCSSLSHIYNVESTFTIKYDGKWKISDYESAYNLEKK